MIQQLVTIERATPERLREVLEILSQVDLPHDGVEEHLAGAFAGVAAAHLMFSERIFSASQHTRAGSAQLFSEFVATFGLLAIIWGCSRRRPDVTPFAVGAYITAADV